MSTAERYAEDMQRLERRVADQQQVVDAQREEIRSLETAVDIHKGEIEELHRQIAFERSRADRFMRYTVAMSAYFESTWTAVEKARQMGLEASQEASRLTLGEMSPDEKEALVSLASRLAPVQQTN